MGLNIVDIGYLKSYLKKTLIGLGALRGSPAKVQSVTPNYDGLDPTVITSHTVTLKYEGNPGQAAALNVPVTWETKAFKVLNGKLIYSIIYDSRDTDYFYYTVTFNDSTTMDMKIPRVVQSQQMIVVDELPPVATAREDAYYLLRTDPTKDIYVKYVKVLNEAGTEYEWLSLGSTEMDLDGYQKKIDEDIIKSYKNYDPATKDAKPMVQNVVGAINTFEKEIGANYNNTTEKITNLNTLHKDNLVTAVNEIGYIPDLEFYDTATGKPETLVEAINLANKDYSLDKNTTVDRTKYIDTLKLMQDTKDGSPKTQVGDTVELPRVDLKLQAIPTSDTSYVDYRTYNLYEANELTDPNDTSNTPFGAVHIPQIKIKKKVPIDTETKVETKNVEATDWDTTVTPHKATIILTSTPESITSIKNGTVSVPFTNEGKVVTITDASTPAMTLTITYEVQTMSAQYFLEIEGKSYDSTLCGATIDILKNAFLKDIVIVTNTEDNVPVPGLLKDLKSICFIFEDASGSEKKTYLPVKDLMKLYVGKDGIDIDDSTSATETYISIKLYDPDTLEALVADVNGLRIMKASQTQYGVVLFATQDEVLTPNTSTDKSVRPIDLYDFVTKSESVKDDVGTLYTDADGKIVNNTVTKAISELSTVKVEKRADTVVDEKNITEYQFETLPVAGVKRQLGDAVLIPRTVVQVEKITDVATPKDYILYYLTADELPTYEVGLYEYINNAWVKVSGGSAIVEVDKLPDGTTDPIYEDRFYLLNNTDTVNSRYRLSDSAIASGVTAGPNGLKIGTVDISWAAVLTDWASYKDDELVLDADGIIYLIDKSDGTQKIVYDYENVPLELYFNKDDTWHKVYQPERITRQMIDELEIED